MSGHALHLVPLGLLQAIILGFLQGLTEFLPVSSTAHMLIGPQLFGLPDLGSSFSAMVQFGPVVAIVFYFRHDLVRYVHGILRSGSLTKVKPDDIDAKLGWYTLFGTLPLIFAGLLLEKKVDHQFRRLDVCAVALIVFALFLWVAERVGKQNHHLDKSTFKQTQVIGWAQVLALLPGASRSGVTIAAGLFEGLDRESAARFSFLLSIPAITAAACLKTFRVLRADNFHQVAAPYFIATIVAAVVAYIVVSMFMHYMKENSTGVFIGYRIALGAALLILLHLGLLQNRPPESAPLTPAPTVAMRSAPQPLP